MQNELVIELVQLNPTLGAIEENTKNILKAWVKAPPETDVVVFPEACITGYPQEDLVLKPSFTRAARSAVELLAEETRKGSAMVVSAPWADGDVIYNALLFLADGEIKHKIFKHHLPNYGVFDEKRVFEAALMGDVVDFKGFKLGLMICEDLWYEDVARRLSGQGADVLIAPHASPYAIEKIEGRRAVARKRVMDTGLPVIVVNQVGGQDELVFDGSSFALNNKGIEMCRLASFEVDCQQIRLSKDGAVEAGDMPRRLEGDEELYAALVLGLRDYVNKNGFPGVLIGLSGGVDSALTAAIAVDALGADRVWTVMMPSRYTSDDSLEDATQCAEMLECRHDVIEIEPMVGSFGDQLNPLFEGRQPDTTEENIQARIRGVLLMGLSNKFGHMVVATGNKSEMSVGYSTLYGDLCGGYAILKDVYKIKAFDLCRWRNENVVSGGLGPKGRVIPERVITKPPSAELRADQKDEDSLPPYDELDAILHGLVEEDLSISEIASRGYERQTVARVEHMLYIAEYKRRQAPPGVKITGKLFGRDRRYPITNRFRNAHNDD